MCSAGCYFMRNVRESSQHTSTLFLKRSTIDVRSLSLLLHVFGMNNSKRRKREKRKEKNESKSWGWKSAGVALYAIFPSKPEALLSSRPFSRGKISDIKSVAPNYYSFRDVSLRAECPPRSDKFPSRLTTPWPSDSSLVRSL